MMQIWSLFLKMSVSLWAWVREISGEIESEFGEWRGSISSDFETHDRLQLLSIVIYVFFKE